jgi:hypothetical protein
MDNKMYMKIGKQIQKNKFKIISFTRGIIPNTNINKTYQTKHTKIVINLNKMKMLLKMQISNKTYQNCYQSK